MRQTNGWIAVAASESHFASGLLAELGLENASRRELERIFAAGAAAAWQEWAIERDLLLTAVQMAEHLANRTFSGFARR